MHPNTRGLAFLLSIGSLPLACTPKDDGDGDGSTTPGTSGTGPTTADPTTGVGMSSTPTTGDTGDSTTGNSGNSGTGDTTGGATTTTTGPLDTGDTEPQATTFLTTNTETGFETDEPPPPPTDPICIAYAEHVVACVPRYAGYENYLASGCEYNKAYAMMDGQACVDAFDAVFVCLSKVDCAEFTDPENPPPSCAAEIAALDAACPSFDEPETTGGGSEGGSDSASSSG